MLYFSSKLSTKFKVFFLLGFLFFTLSSIAQNSIIDEQTIKKIYDKALSEKKGYQWLHYLCKEIGPRLSGSENASKAVDFGKLVMDSLELDRVFLQEVMVPHWVRGETEKANIYYLNGSVAEEVTVCAIGNSVSTKATGLRAKVVEVKSFEELARLGKARVQGKIVFFNVKMDDTKIETFDAYSKISKYRIRGASEAAKYGAVGVVVRSITTRINDVPHTGTLRYTYNLPKLPAVSISTKGAETLHNYLITDPNIEFYFKTNCSTYPDALSYNVVGEWRGSEYPEQIILVGGHLDSWDLGEGAHDDGAGVAHTLEVVRLLKAINYQPKRTIRIVLFMNEENGLQGGIKYAQLAAMNGEYHLIAIESDAGGFTPRGFTVDDARGVLWKMQQWEELLSPYGIDYIKRGSGGADISPLRNQGVTLVGFRPDSQRYFDYHHTDIDVFEAVHPRELQLGAAGITALVYLIDKYGL